MEGSAFEVDGGELFFCDGHASRIRTPIQSCADLQTGLGGGSGIEVDDDLMTDQRLASPVLGDVGKHAVLDLVPFTCAGRKVADVNGQTKLGCQVLQGDFPKTAAAAV